MRIDRDGRQVFVQDEFQQTQATLTTAASTSNNNLYGSYGNIALDQGKRGRSRSRSRSSSPRKSTSNQNTAAVDEVMIDAWARLLSKEQKARGARYNGSDKTLIVLLEEERIRYIHLETEYHKLLTDIQALQATHTAEVKTANSRADQQLQQYQRTLAARAAENSALQTQVETNNAVRNRERAQFGLAAERYEAHIAKLQALMRESDTQLDHVEHVHAETLKRNAEMQREASVREAELKRMSDLVRETQAASLRDQEAKALSDVRIVQLEAAARVAEEDKLQLKSLLARARDEINELSQLKPALEESKGQLRLVQDRGKQMLADAEASAIRESKLIGEVEALSQDCQRYVADIERISDQDAQLRLEMDSMLDTENRLRSDIQSLHGKLSAQHEELNQTNKQLRIQASNVTILEDDCLASKSLVKDLRSQLEDRDSELDHIKSREAALTRELGDSHKRLDNTLANVKSKQSEISRLQITLSELDDKFDQQNKTNTSLQLQLNNVTIEMQSRIQEILQQGKEANSRVADYEKEISALRSGIRKREEQIASLNSELNEARVSLDTVKSQLDRESTELRALQSAKRDEFSAIQEKFSAARAAMDGEVSHVRAQLAQRLQMIAALTEETSKIKIEMSDLAAEKFRLEARVGELTANESSYQRQINNLQNALQQKEQEASLLSLKHKSMSDHVRRMEDEMSAYRQTSSSSTFASAASQQKDMDLNRLQQNISELGKRLKSQVDLLAESTTADVIKTRSSSAPSYNLLRSASPSGSNLKLATTNIYNSPLYKASSRNNLVGEVASPVSQSNSTSPTRSSRGNIIQGID